MRNADCQAHQGQQEQLLEERCQEIQNVDYQACSAQCELDCANQGGNQVIPLGEMTIVYGKCGALHFLEERVASSSRANPQFTLCCTQGKVTMPPLAPPPKPLRRLLTGNEVDAKDFR